ERSVETLEGLPARVAALLAEIQTGLRDQAIGLTQSRTIQPASYEEMRAFLQATGGFAVGPWCGRPACEARVKEDTTATIRFLPLDPSPVDGLRCLVCGEPARDTATWARAY